jgi:murein DD-endopeptidase MepM/ murein hydrolase activator NlpD
MRYAGKAARLLPLITTLAACAAMPGVADADTGGVEYGARLSGGPVLSDLSVPTAVPSGELPRISLRVQEAGVATVEAKVTVASATSHVSVVKVNLGWIHTGHSVLVRWPKGTVLPAGAYQVSVSARDHRGQPLRHGAHSGSGDVSFRVSAPAAPKPLATAAPTPVAVSLLPMGVPTPAQSAAEGAVFPVAGAHNFGGPENAFGAPRDGYSHQGQDILTTEGTPIVAPMSGTILTTSYQEGGAGYYAVEQTGVGFDFMFAHCEAESLAVSTGQAIAPGQVLCRAGQTGDATTPHVDFEMWVGGWQTSSGHPINPLPYLEAWQDAG